MPRFSPGWTALRSAAPALIAYVAVRSIGLAAFTVCALLTGQSPIRLLTSRWDGWWYRSIAVDGYGLVVEIKGRLLSDLAFFPLYPALTRLVGDLTPLELRGAGLAISWLASLVAAWGIFAIGNHLHNRRTGTTLTILWAAFPVAIVQTMAYTEALFTALAAWTLYALLTNRWLTASLLCTLAGLTRPTAAALIAAITITALTTYTQQRQLHWRPLTATLTAPLGWLTYITWVAHRTGNPLGYFHVQSQWGNDANGGNSVIAFVWDQLTGTAPLRGVGLAVAIAGLVALFVLCVRQRPPLPLLVFTAAILALALFTTGHFNAVPRVIMPAFPLLLPLAVPLARASKPVRALVLGLLAAGSVFYGVHMLVLGQAPP